MSAPGTVPDADFEDALDRRRIEVILGFSRTLRLPVTATLLVISAIVWNSAPPAVILAWFVLGVLARELRAYRVEVLASSALSTKEQLRRIARWDVPIGVSHGSAAFFMPFLPPSYDALLTMILVSLAAGAVSTSAVYLPLYLTYAVCVFVPTGLLWLLTGTPPLAYGVAALIAMFAMVQFRFAKENSLTFEQSFRIRIENEALVRELAAARDAAESANSAKSRFLAAASHDLRQPLHALMLHSGLLAQNPLPADAPAIATELSSSLASLGQLLDSLLDISKLDARVVQVQRRAIKLQRLVQYVVGGYAAQASERGIDLRVTCADDAVIVTDPLLLERLLRNLVDNAVKYTDRGEVWVHVEPEGGRFAVSVRDTGCGIPSEAQAKVFEEFFQIGNDGRDRSRGLGLGLAIVARVSALLDTPLELRSDPGIGTTVTFRVPRASAVVADEPASAAAPAALAGVRVLFIDDDNPVRRAMRKVLDRFGCQSVEAASSAEALSRAVGFEPQIVLADYRLADGDSGIEAIMRLRETRPHLPALLISGDTDRARLVEAEDSGLQILHKPVSMERLRVAMQRALVEGAAPPNRESDNDD